jgi:hypothetical protein
MTIDSAYVPEVFTKRSTLLYKFGFEISVDSSVNVYAIDADGVYTLLDSALYTLTLNNYRSPISQGGTIEFAAALDAAVVSISVNRSTPITDTQDFPNGEAFNAQAYEYQADKLTLILQEINASVCDCRGGVEAGLIVLNFEDIQASHPSTSYPNILNFYNGGVSSDGTSGVNYGVSFGGNALAICLNLSGTTPETCSNVSRGGLGDPNSQTGGLFWLSDGDTVMNVPAGFTTGLSFYYTAINLGGAVQVYDGLDGTGNVLATLLLSTTAEACALEYNAPFCPFVPAGILFSGIAKSVNFAGSADQVVFDDVTLGSDVPYSG